MPLGVNRGDLGALESGPRASTEPCSTVSALTGFDPERVRVRTARQDIRGVAERFRTTHGQNLDGTAYWRPGVTKRQIYEALLALNVEVATRADVAAIIGNDSWIGDACDFCEVKADPWFQLGDEPDYEARWIDVCPPCLERLGALAAAAREGGDVQQAPGEAPQSGAEAVTPTSSRESPNP